MAFHFFEVRMQRARPQLISRTLKRFASSDAAKLLRGPLASKNVIRDFASTIDRRFAPQAVQCSPCCLLM